MTNRRDWLTSVGAFAAGGLAAAGFGPGMNEALGVEDSTNPAANVTDRTTSIKITKLTATPVMRKVFLKMETNHGVTGWGEIDQLEPYVATALVKSLFELLDGENPTRIEHLWQKIYRSHRDMRGGPFMTHTLAGIDMALWDITGKLCNPYTVHWVYDTAALANGTGGAVVKAGGKTWFFLTVDYAFGHSLQRDVAAIVTKAGGQVLGEVRHPLNTQDFSSFLVQAQASKAQIMPVLRSCVMPG